MGITAHKLPTKGWKLFTRGGTNGVFIQKFYEDHGVSSEEIEIPSEILRMLVADDIRNMAISRLEQIEDEKLLKSAFNINL